MRTLKLSARSAACFATVTLLLLVLVASSAVGLNSLYKAEQDVETNWMASIAQTARMDSLCSGYVWRRCAWWPRKTSR
ncbi:hypothetical protein [Pseudomonas sp. LA5]|uniref:hypothetical protein n=1 Tax=Pseudomonas sp. LA5 TaxID=3027850 RepID=UPI003FD52312